LVLLPLPVLNLDQSLEIEEKENIPKSNHAIIKQVNVNRTGLELIFELRFLHSRHPDRQIQKNIEKKTTK